MPLMMKADEKRAVVTSSPKNPEIKRWLSDQNGLKIGIKSKWEEQDVAIFIGENKKALADEVKVLKKSQYNNHRNWHRAGKKLKNWESGAFHLGNALVMATWLSGKRGASRILFADVKAEKQTNRFRKDIFREVMKKMKREFEMDIMYTDKSSQLFSDIGGTHVEELFNQNKQRSTSLPSKPSPFQKKRFSGNPKSVIKPASGSIGPTAIYGNERFTCATAVPKKPNRIAEPNVFVLNPNDETVLKNAILSGKNVYLLNEDIDLSGYNSIFLKTFIAFAVGGKEVETNGIINKLGEDEKSFLKAVAKNDNCITHV